MGNNIGLDSAHHYHHVIGFDTLEKIEWHLANLFNGDNSASFHTVKRIPAKEHRKHTAKQQAVPGYFTGKPGFHARFFSTMNRKVATV